VGSTDEASENWTCSFTAGTSGDQPKSATGGSPTVSSALVLSEPRSLLTVRRTV